MSRQEVRSESMKKVLVTGAGGMAGSHMCDYFCNSGGGIGSQGLIIDQLPISEIFTGMLSLLNAT